MCQLASADQLGLPLLSSTSHTEKSMMCIDRKIDPVKASVQLIADSLLFLFRERNLTSGTIVDYRSCIIASVLSFHGKPELSSSTSLSALIRSFSLDRPRIRQ